MIEIKNLSFMPDRYTYFERRDENKTILKNIDLEIPEGSIYGITGESGSGKTTLAKLITGILQPTQGEILFGDEVINHPIQILFQNNDELINPLRSVEDILLEAAKPVDQLNEICQLVGIPEKHFQKKGYQLSGGERQRVGLARILMADPKVLILDEPFSAQDPESQHNLLEVLTNINKQFRITIICISHDIQTLNKLCTQIAILYGGGIVEKGLTVKVFGHAKHPYTNFLIEAAQYSLSRDSFGDTNGVNTVSSACPYYNRCNRKSENCIDDVTTIISGEQVTYCNHPV